MGFCSTRTKIAVCLIVLLFPVAALRGQSCQPTETNICLALTPKSNVLASLPEALQVRNNEQVTINLTNVSPLEACKLTSITFTPAPPPSAIQGAVTAIAGIAPFGIGSLLTALPAEAEQKNAAEAGNHAYIALSPQEHAKQPTDPIAEAHKLQTDVIDDARTLIAMQSGAQQDGVAVATMYTNFSQTDYRASGTFDKAFTTLYGALQKTLQYVPPGEQAAQASGAYRQVKPEDSDGLLAATTQSANPDAPLIVNLQAKLDQAKSLMTTAHGLYDKDPKKLAALQDTYATSDRLVSVATQLLALIGTNDTALKTQQTSLMTLKNSLDLLKTNATNADGTWKETAVLPVPRAKNGTEPGNITCVNRLDNTKVTLDTMPFNIVYQKVPLLSFSSGILISPIQEQVFGTNTIVDTNAPAPSPTEPPTPATTETVIAMTSSAAVQVVPFSFLNLRIGPGLSYRPSTIGLYAHHPHAARFFAKRVFTFGVSGGIGINPNGGSTNAEFFGGAFAAIDRLMFHAGYDSGHIQNLTGGYAINDVVASGATIPTTTTTVGKFTGAISVRLYP